MIDSHAHLLCFDDNKEIINKMKEDGLEFIVTIGTTVEDSRQSVDLALGNKNVFATVGIYPEYANNVSEKDLLEIESLAKNEKVVAVGEIGLDYHNEGYDKEKQKEIFIKQLQIADKVGLPFCIHCRNAVEDVYDVLSKNKHLIKNSGVMHCYSEGAAWIEKFLDLGLYISFSGNITFKKSDRSFLNKIPLDRLIVETDAPYLSPEPLRGRLNQPKNIRFIIEKIAKELNLEFDELEKITNKNAKNLYFKLKKV